MKAIMIMYDSLCRRFLPPYGGSAAAPNFTRLANRCVSFDNAYACSLPCMPARRELHTGRANFLHRSWGPVEPYDDSMPEILQQNGIWSHLITDHYHYWEDGGATYHSRYKTYELSRGQEGDPWKALIGEAASYAAKNVKNPMHLQDLVNRKFMDSEKKQPQSVTFKLAEEFIEQNHNDDNWYLHIETFDPHEPFQVVEPYLKMYKSVYDEPGHDWLPYAPTADMPANFADHLRYLYLALVAMCDANLGKILDLMDKHNLWEDTMLIVNTDHGIMLGEHGFLGKCYCPFYNEIAHTPLFVWDPRIKAENTRSGSLVQTIDLAPTILDYFGLPIPADMLGKPLTQAAYCGEPIREAGIFGIHGGQINVTDARYVYMRSPADPDNNTPLYEYGLMPMRHGSGRAFIQNDLLCQAVQSQSFSFTKGIKPLRIPCYAFGLANTQAKHKTALYDLQSDPSQLCPIDDPVIEKRMIQHLVSLMNENDCPEEQYKRMGL